MLRGLHLRLQRRGSLSVSVGPCAGRADAGRPDADSADAGRPVLPVVLSVVLPACPCAILCAGGDGSVVRWSWWRLRVQHLKIATWAGLALGSTMTMLLYLLFLPDLRALGAPEFAIRERAEARLSLYADLVYPLLPVNSSDLEVRRRARRVRALAVPEAMPPIALLAGRPTTEWWTRSEDPEGRIHIGTYPGEEWTLTWIRPDQYAPGLARVVMQCYGERARTQWMWRDWHSVPDGREATRLLVDDLVRVGVPPVLLRRMISHLRAKERALYASPLPLRSFP